MAFSALVIEDDSATSFIFQQVLMSLGLTVTCANNGAIALECLHKNQYDLVLMDLLLPRVSGLELLQQRHQLEPFRNCPLVVVTAHANLRNNVVLGPRDQFLLKPIFVRDLHQVVNSVFPPFNSRSL